MNHYVLDASVIFKWFHSDGENNILQAKLLRDSYLNGEIHVTIPDLLIYEIANILVFKRGINDKQILEVLDSLWQLEFTVITTNSALIKKAVLLSHKQGVSVYDSSYVALAQAIDAVFVTADKKLYSKLDDSACVVLLSE